MILFAYNEGSDRAARKRRLIWALLFALPEDTFSHGAAYMLKVV